MKTVPKYELGIGNQLHISEKSLITNILIYSFFDFWLRIKNFQSDFFFVS